MVSQVFLGGSVGTAVSTVLGGCAEKGQSMSWLQQAAVSYSPAAGQQHAPAPAAQGTVGAPCGAEFSPSPAPLPSKLSICLMVILLLGCTHCKTNSGYLLAKQTFPCSVFLGVSIPPGKCKGKVSISVRI